jgi:hypothetical protein
MVRFGTPHLQIIIPTIGDKRQPTLVNFGTRFLSFPRENVVRRQTWHLRSPGFPQGVLDLPKDIFGRSRLPDGDNLDQLDPPIAAAGSLDGVVLSNLRVHVMMRTLVLEGDGAHLAVAIQLQRSSLPRAQPIGPCLRKLDAEGFLEDGANDTFPGVAAIGTPAPLMDEACSRDRPLVAVGATDGQSGFAADPFVNIANDETAILMNVLLNLFSRDAFPLRPPFVVA